jgi:hypothetical protein
MNYQAAFQNKLVIDALLLFAQAYRTGSPQTDILRGRLIYSLLSFDEEENKPEAPDWPELPKGFVLSAKAIQSRKRINDITLEINSAIYHAETPATPAEITKALANELAAWAQKSALHSVFNEKLNQHD